MAVRFEGVSADIGLNGDFYRAAGSKYSAFDIAESKHPRCDLIVAPCPTVHIRYGAIPSVDNDVLYDQLVMFGLDLDNRATVVAVDKGYFKRRFFRFDFTFNTAQAVPFRRARCSASSLSCLSISSRVGPQAAKVAESVAIRMSRLVIFLPV